MKLKDLIEFFDKSLYIAIYYAGEVRYFIQCEDIPIKFLSKRIIEISVHEGQDDTLYITVDD